MKENKDECKYTSIQIPDNVLILLDKVKNYLRKKYSIKLSRIDLIYFLMKYYIKKTNSNIKMKINENDENDE